MNYIVVMQIFLHYSSTLHSAPQKLQPNGTIQMLLLLLAVKTDIVDVTLKHDQV